jgi:hypothetical protein
MIRSYRAACAMAGRETRNHMAAPAAADDTNWRRFIMKLLP